MQSWSAVLNTLQTLSCILFKLKHACKLEYLYLTFIVSLELKRSSVTIISHFMPNRILDACRPSVD